MRLFGTLKKLTLHLIALVNVVVIILMIITAYAGHVSPEEHKYAEVVALAFPFPAAVNLLFLLFWLFVRVRNTLIPIAGMLLCAGALRDYCPIHLFSSSPPEDAIKVLSYNVCNFSGPNNNKSQMMDVAEYICKQDADIVCLQETSPLNKSGREDVDIRLRRTSPYCRRFREKVLEEIAVYSKHPIRWAIQAPYMTKRNNIMVCSIDLGDDTLLVFNAHLQSIRLNPEDRKEIKEFVKRKGKNIDESSIIEKVATTAQRRAAQADHLVRGIKKRTHTTTILCGDFNSSPNCYPHHVISQWLDDCYTATATGPGFTLKQSGIFVRIDNIFCSHDLKPYKCQIDTKNTFSDHYPVSCWVKKRAKP